MVTGLCQERLYNLTADNSAEQLNSRDGHTPQSLLLRDHDEVLLRSGSVVQIELSIVLLNIPHLHDTRTPVLESYAGVDP